MQKRYSDALTNKLEQCLVTQKWCTIKEQELRLWYGQKLTINVWRDIQDRLDELSEENSVENSKISIFQFGGNILFVMRDNLTKLEKML